MKKTLSQKELRKNQKLQRYLSDKDDSESKKKMERLKVEENKILQKMETDKQRKENRLGRLEEKEILKSMTLGETLEYYKNLDKGSVKVEEHHIPNTRESRIHRKKVIQSIHEYKMDQYFMEQIEMRRKLKAFIESIESDD
jgi:hypothetical protein